MSSMEELDVVLVGAGLAGFYALHKLRSLGFKTKIYERAAAAGGIWYWNCYEGARVDSEFPTYQLFDKELYQDWTFTSKFPDWKELRSYFEYVEKKWNLKKDICYNSNVTDAEFDESQRKWIVTLAGGKKIRARWFIPCVGFSAKHYVPDIPGLEKFKGPCHHTSLWPHEGLDVTGKRVAVIGTGATGVQYIQECGPIVKHLTVYQRTPNLAIPMRQGPVSKETQDKMKESGEYERIMVSTYSTFGGFHFGFSERKCFDDTPEQRQEFYTHLWNSGGFRFWLATYANTYFDEAANNEAYQFWRNKTLQRIVDPKKADLLAPATPPHPFGTKRPSLEQRYFEVYNQDNVDLIDISSDPIVEMTEHGIRTGKTYVEVDVVVLATGFDCLTGSMAQINIRGTSGATIAEHWKDGLYTYLGMACQDFPNMFFIYGPQAATAFTNAPTFVQVQANWISELLCDLERRQITRIEATHDAEIEWKRKVDTIWKASLFSHAHSWYQGYNIPGKRIEALNYAAGLPNFLQELEACRSSQYAGFVTSLPECDKVELNGQGDVKEGVDAAGTELLGRLY